MHRKIRIKNRTSLFILLFVLIARIVHAEIGYNSRLSPSKFFHLDKRKFLHLPAAGTITLFYFPFANTKSKTELDYFSALSSCFSDQQLSIYNVVMDSTMTPITELESITPTTDIYQSVKEMSHYQPKNIVVLVDCQRVVKYIGPLGSPDKFSFILQKLGLDFSFRPPDLNNLVSEYATWINVFTDEKLVFSDLKENKKLKMFFFYRSFCAPCGDQLLIEQMFQLVQTHSDWQANVYLVLRDFDEVKADAINTALARLCITFENIYRLEDTTPEIERYFLLGNPLILCFSPELEFVKARIGNHMYDLVLEKFFVDMNQKYNLVK